MGNDSVTASEGRSTFRKRQVRQHLDEVGVFRRRLGGRERWEAVEGTDPVVRSARSARRGGNGVSMYVSYRERLAMMKASISMLVHETSCSWPGTKHRAVASNGAKRLVHSTREAALRKRRRRRELDPIQSNLGGKQASKLGVQQGNC